VRPMWGVWPQPQDVFVVSESWMSVEEAETWCDAAMWALSGDYLHRADDIDKAKCMLDASPTEREQAADHFDWEAETRVSYHYPRRVLCVCAAILRAVKT